MDVKNLLTRPIPFLLGCGAGILIGIGALLLTFSLKAQGETPAAFLPADTRLLFVERGKGGDESLSSLLPGLPSVSPLPNVTNIVTDERAVALLPSGTGETRVSFYRIRPGRRFYQEAEIFTQTQSPRAAVFGAYIALGESDLSSLLHPSSSADTLARSPLYRSLEKTLSPSSSSFLFQKALSGSILPLPSFLQQAASSGGVLLSFEKRGKESLLTVSLPGEETTFSAPLPPIPYHAGSEREHPLLFAGNGEDAAGDFQRVISLLGDTDEDRAVILRGVMEASFQTFFGREMSFASILPSTPYAFLLRSGSGTSTEWLLSLSHVHDREDEEGKIAALEKGFASRFPPALIRTRTLPTGLPLQDIMQNPEPLAITETPYHGATLRILRDPKTGIVFAEGKRGGLLFLSNAEALLRESLEADASASVTESVHLPRRAFERFGTLFPEESPFFSSLRDFLGKSGSMTWSRLQRSGQVQHVFLLKPL